MRNAFKLKCVLFSSCSCIFLVLIAFAIQLFIFIPCHIFQISFDFRLLFEGIDDKSLEKKWDTLHDKPLSEFKDQIDLNKVPISDASVWQFITTCITLKPRGDFWKSFSSFMTFTDVRNTLFCDKYL